MKAFASKRRISAATVAILLILFLVRPGASRLKNRITNSISRAVARPTDIGSVHLRFLPRPGFDLENLVIYEDPAFGAEPMLRAAEVTAVVRLTSLLRGRLDIARLELTEPSLNLVQREDGRWNLAALLERTSHTPLAPTAKGKSEARPGFPYIEATGGRINFKTGSEKKPYALLNADFALWQESENDWGVRLRAEPLRADMNLSDTGLLRINGTWQRAGSLRETPLLFNVVWERAQLGQLTKLVTGNDKGWRGDVSLQVKLSGTPDAMLVATDGAIRDFHRYDIPTTESLGLAAHCDGKYYSAEGMMRDMHCLSQVGEGSITLRGEAGLPGTHALNLLLNVENVPLGSVAQLARRAKKNLPSDLVASGSMQGNFSVREDGKVSAGPEFEGRGRITDLQLASAGTKAELDPGTVPFQLSSRESDAPVEGQKSTRAGRRNLKTAEELRFEYGPFPVALDRPVPTQVRGWVARSGYAMSIHGEGEVGHVLRIAGLLGLPVTKANAEGGAQMDLQIAGLWTGDAAETNSGFAAPKVTGTVQLHNVRASLRGVGDPIEITAAQLSLLPDEARVDNLDAQFGEARWTGWVHLPRGCGTPDACEARFNLSTDDVAMRQFLAAAMPKSRERRWYQVLTQKDAGPPAFLVSLHALGTVNAARLKIHDVVATRVSAAVEVDRGQLRIANLRADLLGGKHHGEWNMVFTGATPKYTGSGTMSGIDLEKVSDAMHDPWISGNASGTYEVQSSGTDAGFWKSIEGRLRFEVRDGALLHVSLPDNGPLKIARWKGEARLHEGNFEAEKSEIKAYSDDYEISGTASSAQVLDFRLSNGTSKSKAVYSITGTLAEPRVALEPAAETQAQLKP